MTTMPTSPILADEVLSQRQKLPSKFAPVKLSGASVWLEPLDMRHLSELFAASNGRPLEIDRRGIDAYDPDELVWRYMGSGPFASEADMAKYMQALIDNANGLALTVVDASSHRAIGVATYMNNFPEHLKIELGNIWYSPVFQRTAVNTETIYLMLKHAFELGYRRLEWKCDALNERSRKAALRLGFKFEGIQEYHFIVKNRNRDTAWFRILDSEWTAVAAHLEALLGL